MARTFGSTYEDVYESYSSTRPDLNPIENLVMAIVEQAIRDYATMLKEKVSQLDRSQVSVKDVMSFLEEEYDPYKTFLNIDCSLIANQLKQSVEIWGEQKTADILINNLADARVKKNKKEYYTGEHSIELSKLQLNRVGLNKEYLQNYYPNNYVNLSDTKWSWRNELKGRNVTHLSDKEKRIVNDLVDTYKSVKEKQKANKLCQEYNIER